jgi:hypothetical protein
LYYDPGEPGLSIIPHLRACNYPFHTY